MDKPFEVKQFRRNDRQLIHYQHGRIYKLDKKTVAKNRKRAAEQPKKELSLEEHVQTLPESERQKTVSKLKAIRSKRAYNDLLRDPQGTVFWYKGKRYIKSGQSGNGKKNRAVGFGTRDYPAKECRIVKSGELVYL